MKRLIVLAVLLTPIVAAGQNISCTTSGNSVYCSNGISGTRSGNTMYFSDGTVVQSSGNALYFTGVPFNDSSERETQNRNNPAAAFQAGYEAGKALAQQRRTYTLSVDRAIQKAQPNMLAKFVRECVDTPAVFKREHERLLHEDDDKSFLSDEQKQEWRNIVSAKPAVPENWRIDSAEDFQQCLDGREQNWRNIGALGSRHPDFLDHASDMPYLSAFLTYLNHHFGTPRFDVYTFEQMEQAYYEVKNGR